MSRLDEQLTGQFHAWEHRGRGWQVFNEPVVPEPPFRPFDGHYLPDSPPIDDGRRPTFLSTLVQGLSRKLSTEPPPPPVSPETQDAPEPQLLIRDSLIELQTSLPASLNVPREMFEQFLSNLALCREPIAFELLGFGNRVTAQFAVHLDDAPLVRRQLQAYFPEAVFQTSENYLEESWQTGSGEDELVVEFGLAREFMLPLAIGKLDPFVGIVGALSELQAGEVALFQVLFQSTHQPWSESIIWSVSHADGKPFFVNSPELAKAAENKVSRPLYAAVVRIAVGTENEARTLQLARDLAGSLRVFAHPNGNELIPLSNEEYPFEEHVEDVLRRQSRRSGMLLNSDELIGFVHLPSSAVQSAAFQRDTGKSKAAPQSVRTSRGLLLGKNVHSGNAAEVRLSPEQRVRHAHFIGASGTGKSTLLFNLIRQDIENGEGVAVLDPHGDLIDRVLGSIPPERVADVIVFDAADETHSIAFNILTAHTELEKTLLASDLISVFQRLSASWGDQMASVLQNGILAFLESSRGGTLADLRRFLLDAEFRNDFLATVRDPDLVYYWRKGFPQLGGNKSIGPVLTRLETFLAPKPIRYIVSQPANRLDFADVMDSGKILLVKLPQGQIGKENAFLLGSLLMSKFQQTAMSRQAQQVAARKDFWLYLDEFHHFITPSMAEVLGGARKYRMGLTLAHQELRQLQRDYEVASAVMSNCFTRVVFRVGDDDAKKLADGFALFEARDLQNLDIGQAICRVERSDFDFNLAVPLPEEPDETTARQRRQEIIAASREKYGTPRAEIEAMLAKRIESVQPKEPKPAPTKALTKVEPAPVVPLVAEVRNVVEPEAQPKPAAEPPPPPPKVEIPVVTGSEKESSISTPESPVSTPPGKDLEKLSEATVATAEQPALRDKGIGGNQHNLIRERIEKVARQLGYSTSREHRVGQDQKVDVVLEKLSRAIACEIAITTTIDHEVGNVAKCLKAGFKCVAVVSPSEDRLGKIKQAVEACLQADEIARVEFYTPDRFLAHLQELADQDAKVPVATTPSETTYGKYKVKTKHASLTAEERKQREAVAVEMLAGVMRQQK